MAKYIRKDLDTRWAAAIIMGAVALFVGVFLFFGSKYDAEYQQVTQDSSALPAPGNEVPATPKPIPSQNPTNL